MDTTGALECDRVYSVSLPSMGLMKGPICSACPVGTFQNSTGVVTNTSCLACPAGKFSSANGSAWVLTCPEGHYQSLVQRSSKCVECKDEMGKLMTNAPDFKSCVPLSSPSIAEMLFTDSVAYYVSFSVGAVFLALCGIMHYMREEDQRMTTKKNRGGQEVVKLAQLSLFQMVIKAVFQGSVLAARPL